MQNGPYDLIDSPFELPAVVPDPFAYWRPDPQLEFEMERYESWFREMFPDLPPYEAKIKRELMPWAIMEIKVAKDMHSDNDFSSLKRGIWDLVLLQPSPAMPALSCLAAKCLLLCDLANVVEH